MKTTPVTEHDRALRALAYRTVADELAAIVRPRPELAEQTDSPGDATWVLAFINYAVEALKQDLADLASRDGAEIGR